MERSYLTHCIDNLTDIGREHLDDAIEKIGTRWKKEKTATTTEYILKNYPKRVSTLIEDRGKIKREPVGLTKLLRHRLPHFYEAYVKVMIKYNVKFLDDRVKKVLDLDKKFSERPLPLVVSNLNNNPPTCYKYCFFPRSARVEVYKPILGFLLNTNSNHTLYKSTVSYTSKMSIKTINKILQASP